MALLAGCWIWIRISTPGTIQNARPKGSAIIALGNSITEGYGLPADRTYPALLSREFGLPIINQGLSGDTTEGGIRRLELQVLAHNPRVVFIELGGNDLLHKIPRSRTRGNLEEMARRIQAAGAAVVLLAVDGPPGFEDLDRLYRQVARTTGAVHVPNVIEGFSRNPEFMADEFHPNARGHQIMAQRIATVLRQSLPAVFP